MKKILIFITLVIILVSVLLITKTDIANCYNTANIATTANIEDTSTKENEVKQYKVGETYKDEFISIKLLAFDDNFTAYKDDEFLEDGCKVLKVEFEHEYLSELVDIYSDRAFTIGNLYCIADDDACPFFWWNGFEGPTTYGNKIVTPSYYQIPKDATNITLVYVFNFDTNEYIEFKVK